MKAEYKEGPEARENFEKLASALFQVPVIKEPKPKEKRQPKKAASRKSPGKDKA